MEFPQLQETAAFSMAKHLWRISGIFEEILSFIGKGRRNYYSFKGLDKTIKIQAVQQLLIDWYPYLSCTILVETINAAIKSMGEEIFDWIEEEYNRIQWRACESRDIKKHFDSMNFEDIHWSPFFTIDRMKSNCRTKEFNLIDVKLCDCCFEYSLKKAYPVLIPYLSWFRHVYGCYAHHALAYIVFCRHEYYRIKEHIFSVFLRDGTAIENIFKLSVLCAYDSGVRYYWTQLTEEQRKNNVIDLIYVCLNEWFGGESKRMFSKKECNTFYFLWNKLSQNEQIKILEAKFPWITRKPYSSKLTVYTDCMNLLPFVTS